MFSRFAYLPITIALLLALPLWAEVPEIQQQVEGPKKPWTSLDVRFAPRDFQFAVVTDNTGTPRPGIFREAMDKLNLLQPSFVMSIGDLIDGYVDTSAELHDQWDDFMLDLNVLKVPFFFVPGNHDVGRPLWYDVYRERIGPTYYYFIYQDVLFLCLDSNDGERHGTGYSEEQMEWAKKVLADHPDVRWTLVFQHKPFWLSSPKDWERLRPALADRPCTVFAGHIHNYVYAEDKGIRYITMGTTGGGTPLRGEALGEFDHVMWVTMTDDGPIMAALALDGILPVDLRTAEKAKQMEVFSRNSAVTASPILVEGGKFSDGTSRLEILNPLDQPLRFDGLIETPEGVLATPNAFHEIIPAGEKLSTEVRLQSEQPVEVAALQPAVLHWEAHYDFAQAPSMDLEGKRRIVIETEHAIPVARDIAVDGNLEDWDDLPYVVTQPADVYTNEQSWTGAQDCSFRFGVAEDDKFLYVAIATEDDQTDTDDVKVYQDFGAIYVNAVPGREVSKEVQEKALFSLLAGEDLSKADRELFEENSGPKGAETAASFTGDGHAYEFAIPVDFLEEIQKGGDRTIQLNIGVNDYDPSQARLGVSVLFWRPRWDASGHFPESGIFHRPEQGTK
ncbi:MAG: metallophosphoesterase [Candidatus Omnitrophica bacterium]|nr:metallophosphoesterase [Candidatus Omnitrophota bacterium]